ncbi:fluoroacetate dehalogenase [Actinomycetospora sp. NBRC 106375]|uniref:alpha/beta fold hydrolase n=1 Tax=Actinomycetospora sp. NBRC 106375 TaxID=3032207 RepID=UPI0024A1812F|nr:alpha/beta hydrolase [Actinomycetospora sp. NBRC 106375]GLZ47874.1 fluoroacetate dehalogenase [Actinomycetospora sp. NBRC 106375]
MTLPGFAPSDVETEPGVRIRIHVAGSGPPVLLLHGWPQTSAMWHAVAPDLARDHTVVAADLRGYGASTAPATARFDKRAMARDQIAVMAALGHERFTVVGHDRGARCAYRLALDHPGAVAALAVLDVLPTGDVVATVDASFALAAWHWFFLAQPGGVPGRMILADPDAFFARHVPDPAPYREAWRRPEVVAAMCADYRAGVTADVAHDEADRDRRAIACPTLVLWGETGPLGRAPDPLGTWQRWAPAATGRALACGHHVAEERPAETLAALRELLDR